MTQNSRQLPDLPRPTTFIDHFIARTTPRINRDKSPIYVDDTLTTNLVASFIDIDYSPPFENGWGNAAQAGQAVSPLVFSLRENGDVEIEGAIAGGAIGDVVFTLPEGYRPRFTARFVIPNGTAGATSILQVDPTGEVTVIA